MIHDNFQKYSAILIWLDNPLYVSDLVICYKTLESKHYSLFVLCKQAFQTNTGLLDKGANNSKIPAPSVISQDSLVLHDIIAPNYTCN